MRAKQRRGEGEEGQREWWGSKGQGREITAKGKDRMEKSKCVCAAPGIMGVQFLSGASGHYHITNNKY